MEMFGYSIGFSLLQVFSLLGVQSAPLRQFRPFIVGGHEASPGRWPWQLALERYEPFGWRFICGAVLIGPEWAVTAAHCTDPSDPTDYRVVSGLHDRGTDAGERIKVTFIKDHENFNQFEVGIPNDIALLKLERPVNTTSQAHASTIKLASGQTDFAGSRNCWITGWGRTGATQPASSVLMELNIPVLTNQECDDSWRTLLANYTNIMDSHICVGDDRGKLSSCMGDSGGPLSCDVTGDGDWVLAGVTSWGYRQCNTMPSVYTRISSFVPWIKHHVPDAEVQM